MSAEIISLDSQEATQRLLARWMRQANKLEVALILCRAQLMASEMLLQIAQAELERLRGISGRAAAE